ncbi:MAG: hypothetical protein SPH93_02455 [Clostridium sp.]|jgi:hypothetical protein|uniref:hypothetical protein n=1 Tax=Clostridium sp. TaxID=1506 RepID=UPI0025B93F04|nr:hypothetical protein [Clostridium sp.]MDY6226533.1 hypothetical protein [Clostridium sp.]
MDIKIRDVPKAVVVSIDERAKKLGYKSRNEFLKRYLEREFILLDKLKEHDSKYEILVEKIITQFECNNLLLNKLCEELLIDPNDLVNKEKLEGG